MTPYLIDKIFKLAAKPIKVKGEIIGKIPPGTPRHRTGATSGGPRPSGAKFDPDAFRRAMGAQAENRRRAASLRSSLVPLVAMAGAAGVASIYHALQGRKRKKRA